MSCCCNKTVVLLNDINTTNIWLNGTGVPAAGLGNDGDYYLDDATGDYYTKVTGAWVLQGNLQGATGAAGAPGTPGGALADQGIFTDTSDLTTFQSKTQIAGNATVVTVVGGFYQYYAVGKVVTLNFEISVGLDTTIGACNQLTFRFDLIPTPGNFSSIIDLGQAPFNISGLQNVGAGTSLLSTKSCRLRLSPGLNRLEAVLYPSSTPTADNFTLMGQIQFRLL